MKPNLAGMVFGWSTFVSDSPTPSIQEGSFY